MEIKNLYWYLFIVDIYYNFVCLWNHLDARCRSIKK